jgi:dsRNA-specific ribonuclease
MVKFHPVMTKPFIDRSEQIRNVVSHFDKDKSGEINLQINEKITYILKTCPKKILDATQYKVRNPNLLLLILYYEDISKAGNETDRLEFKRIIKGIKKDFLTLALIGDRALELGILPIIWEEENSSGDIPTKGKLDDSKKNFVKNKNLADIWDFLGLYETKILPKKKDESPKLRGSRMEAIFGIIYLESGLRAVENAVRNLKTNYEKHRDSKT